MESLRIREVQMFRKSKEALLEMQYSSKKYVSKNVHVPFLLQCGRYVDDKRFQAIFLVP
jgi:hypothetical protein